MLIKNEIIAGVCIAIATFIWIYLEYVIGLHEQHIDYYEYVTNLSLLIPVIGINWAIKKRYYSFAPGEFQLKDGLISGVIVSVVTAFLSLPLLWIFVQYINPYFFTYMISVTVKHAIQQGKNAIQAIHDARDSYNLSSYLIQNFTRDLIFGLLVALMVSYRLVKKGIYSGKKKK